MDARGNSMDEAGWAVRRVLDGWGTGRVPGLLKVLINWELFRRACQKVEDKVLIVIS